jgi:hypothetical protein
MAVSLQRLLIITVTINLLIFMLNASINNQSMEDEYYLQVSSFEDTTGKIQDSYSEGNVDTSQQVLDPKYGDNMLAIGGVWSTLKNGMNPPEMCQTVTAECPAVEKELGKWYKWFFRLINFLLILEILYLAYTKKNG